MILCFMLGFEIRDRIEPDIILMDTVQTQQYLNKLWIQDPCPPIFEDNGIVFTELKEDGVYGDQTRLVHEHYATENYKILDIR